MQPRLGVAVASVLVAVLAALVRPRPVPSPDPPSPRAMADALELRAEPLSVEKHLILGCSPLAGIYGSIPESQAFDTVKTALELGFRDFDTAPHYGLGLSERRLGAALEKHAGETPDVRVWSKVGRVMKPHAEVTDKDRLEGKVEEGNMPGHPGCIFPDAPTDVTPVLDYSAEGVRRSHADSQRRLGAARKIFGLRVHDAEDATRYAAASSPVTGGVDALVEMRESGIIEAVSLGMNDPHYVKRMLLEKPNGTFDSVMSAGAWNLIDQDGLELMLLCQSRGVKIHNAGIFASGLLVGGDHYKYEKAPAEIIARREKWAALAEKHGVPLPAAAIAFALAPAVVEKAAVGVKSADEVRANVLWLEAAANVPKRLWEDAKAQGLLAADVPTPGGE
jgi:D-threo-aldose 1-dehydrogenase